MTWTEFSQIIVYHGVTGVCPNITTMLHCNGTLFKTCNLTVTVSVRGVPMIKNADVIGGGGGGGGRGWVA